MQQGIIEPMTYNPRSAIEEEFVSKVKSNFEVREIKLTRTSVVRVCYSESRNCSLSFFQRESEKSEKSEVDRRKANLSHQTHLAPIFPEMLASIQRKECVCVEN